MRRIWGVALCALVLTGEGRAATEGERRLAGDVAAGVARALAEGEAATAGVTLRTATLEGDRLELDFSGEMASLGLGSLKFERVFNAVRWAAGEVLRDVRTSYEVHASIEGIPLDRWLGLTETPARARAVTSDVSEAPRIQGLATRRIALSPGHGYYLNGNNYVLQRGYWQGIVEDFVNHDLVTLLANELTAAGADVRPTRNLDRTAGNGETGFPKWQEAARYHVKALGADASVWGEAGFTHLEQDIRCRPRYANAVNAEVLVSIHNNGAGTPGAGTGTETLYDTNNGFGAESKRLADILHAKVIAAIRRDYNPNWADRRVQGFNGSYGENRLATRPAVLMEIAFMDRPTPDNAALQDERFKRIVATAIKEGLDEYLEGGSAPAAPVALVAGAGEGGVVLGWRDVANNEAGFRIERRAGANGPWTTVGTAAVNAVSFKDSSAVAGVNYAYRVLALNARGTSAVSNEVNVTARAAGAAPEAWLSNVSLRTTLAAGQTVIVGLVVGGSGSKDVLLRAAGPALRQFGLSAVVAEPRLVLFRDGLSVGTNAGWESGTAGVMARLGAFPFAAGSADAALVRTLEGGHTVQVSGSGAGAVLVEGYDAGSGSAARLVNLSARNRVGTNADILIAGFTVSGTGAQRLLVRAVGPGLSGFGVTGTLSDPKLEIFNAAGVKLAENDNWEVELAAMFGGLGAFPLTAGSRDAAVLVTVPAGGGYTAQVSGVGGATGEALVEIYEAR